MSQGQSQFNRSLFKSGFLGDDLALQKQEELKRPDVTGLVSDLTEAQGLVKVIHGANEDELPLATQTVGQVRGQLDRLFNIAPEATALINGIPVTEGHVLAMGEVLEFMKETGRKGA